MNPFTLNNQQVVKNGITWFVSSIGEILHPKLTPHAELAYDEPSVQLTERVNAADHFWDFSEMDKFYKAPYFYKYDFQDIISPFYRILLKRIVLRELYERDNTFSTTNTYFNIAKSFVHFLESQFIFNPTLIYPKLVPEFLVKEKPSTKEVSKRQILQVIRGFLEEIQYQYADFQLGEFEKVLKDYSRGRIRAEMERGKTPDIPRVLFNKIIQLALKDVDNTELPITYRMIACMILLLSQTGMRRGEFLLLETGRLKEIMVRNGERKTYYLEFITYKTTVAKDGRWTETHMNLLAVKAYQTLVDVAGERRSLADKSNVLYCNKKGKSYNRSIIQKHIHAFFSRHQLALDFHSLSKLELGELSNWIISENDVSDYRYIDRKNIGSIFYYVRPHQFRVAVANELRRNDVAFEWIKRHMNHLEEEMTKHYFRDDKIITDTFKNRASRDGSQLEINPANIENVEIRKELDESELIQAYEAINKFLKKRKLNIFKNLDEILSLLKSTPVRESEIGFCTNTIKLCERQERLATFEKWYYIRPQIADIANFNFTLKRFEDKLKLVAHNEKVADENSKYLRQYELEFKSLQQFYKNKFLPELKLVTEKMCELGVQEFIFRYPDLENVALNIDDIKGAIPQWLMKMN